MQPNEIIKNNSVFIERVTSAHLQSNSYIMASNNTKDAAIIDPILPANLLENEINKNNFKLKCLVNTHGHIDHIEANDEFDAPVYIHSEDSSFLSNGQLNLSQFLSGESKTFSKAEKLLIDEDIIKIGDIDLKILHTPGHTPGSICLYYDGVVFTGDTLFFDGVGRCDFPYASENLLLKSIRERLLKLADSVLVLPGHGPKTTIGREKKFNPFIKGNI